MHKEFFDGTNKKFKIDFINKQSNNNINKVNIQLIIFLLVI